MCAVFGQTTGQQLPRTEVRGLGLRFGRDGVFRGLIQGYCSGRVVRDSASALHASKPGNVLSQRNRALFCVILEMLYSLNYGKSAAKQACSACNDDDDDDDDDRNNDDDENINSRFIALSYARASVHLFLTRGQYVKINDYKIMRFSPSSSLRSLVLTHYRRVTDRHAAPCSCVAL